MLEHVRQLRSKASLTFRLSIELEKIRDYPAMEQLISLADLIFVSKEFAKNKSFNIFNLYS